MVNLFEFNLHPTDIEIVKKQALRCIGKNGGISSMSCTKKYVLKGTEPNWQKGENPTQ